MIEQESAAWEYIPPHPKFEATFILTNDATGEVVAVGPDEDALKALARDGMTFRGDTFRTAPNPNFPKFNLDPTRETT